MNKDMTKAIGIACETFIKEVEFMRGRLAAKDKKIAALAILLKGATGVKRQVWVKMVERCAGNGGLK